MNFDVLRRFLTKRSIEETSFQTQRRCLKQYQWSGITWLIVWFGKVEVGLIYRLHASVRYQLTNSSSLKDGKFVGFSAYQSKSILPLGITWGHNRYLQCLYESMKSKIHERNVTEVLWNWRCKSNHRLDNACLD